MATALLFGTSACTAGVRSDGRDPPSSDSTSPAALPAPSTTHATTTTSLSEPPPVSATPTTETSRQFPDGRACGASKVYVIGDSLTVGATNPGDLQQLLERAGYTARVDAQKSRFIKAGVQILDMLAKRHRETLEPVIMVALGTNDAHAGFTAEAIASLIDQLMTAVGPNRLVVWATTQFLPAYRSDMFNRILKWRAAHYPNLVIAAWDAVDHTQFLNASGVHYDNEGYRLRAAFMLQQLQAVTRCTPATRT